MPLDFNDLIPDSQIHRTPPVKRGTVGFEDLVPKEQRIAYPTTTPSLLEDALKAISLAKEERKPKTVTTTPILEPERKAFRGAGYTGTWGEEGPQLKVGPEPSGFLRKAFGYISPPKPPGWEKASPIEKINLATQPISHILTRIGGKITSEMGLKAKEDIDKLVKDEIAEDLKWYQKTPEAVGWGIETFAEYKTLSGIFKLTGLDKILTAVGQKLAKPFIIKELASPAGQQALKTLSVPGLKALAKKTVSSFLRAAPQNTAFISSWSALDALREGKPVKEIAQEAKKGALWGVGTTAILSIISNAATVPEVKRAMTNSIARLNRKYPRLVDLLGRDIEPEFIDATTAEINRRYGTNVKFVDMDKRAQAVIRNTARAVKAEVQKQAAKEAQIKAYWGAGAPAKKPTPSAKAEITAPAPAAPVTPAAGEPIVPPKPPTPEERPPQYPRQIAKRRALEIMPRKTEVLAQIDEAIEKAPSERELRSKLQREIPEPASTFSTEEYVKLMQEKQKKISDAVEKITSVKLKFDIDGGAEITNTKEALQIFRNAVKSLPEKEYWPTKPAKITVKKPVAATKEKIEPLIKAPKGYFTDGKVLVKGTPPAKTKMATKDRYGREQEPPPISQESIDEILKADTKPAELQHYAVSSPETGKGISTKPIAEITEPEGAPAVAVFKSAGKYYTYEQPRYNVIRKRFPDARYGVNPNTGALIACNPKTNEPVAALMPFQLGEEIALTKPPVELPKAEIEAPADIRQRAQQLANKTNKRVGIYQKDDKWHTFTTLNPPKGVTEYEAVTPEIPAPAEKPIEKKTHEEQIAYFQSETDRMIGRRLKEGDWVFVKTPTGWTRAKFVGYRSADVDENFMRLDVEVKQPSGEIRTLKGISPELVKTELPTKPAPPTAKKQFEIINSRGQRYGNRTFDSREAAQKFLEKKITAPAGRLQFAVQPVQEKGKMDFEDLVPPEKKRLAGPTPEQVERLEEQRFAPAENLQSVVVDTFREWPKPIDKVGKDYWTEVMAVAKSLLTPYRYRALRQTLLGVFRRMKAAPGAPEEVVGIELQDVKDALTATHELSHNLDWLINDKHYPSSIKKRFPDVTGSEVTLRNELKKISQMFRPDLWEAAKTRASRKKYLSHHTELMADYISCYILGPEKARELAPNVTRAFEAKIANIPDIFEAISRLQEARYVGPEEPPIAEHIRETFPLPKEFSPLQLMVDMSGKDYVKAAEELGITASRHYKLLMQRAERDARRIDQLVPNRARQTDLVVIAENGEKNPWTGRTREEIIKEGISKDEQKAITLFRAYQELARQTVNKYLRGAAIAEYISFLENYFIHAYETPLTEKYKTAIARWAKSSPSAKKRVLPDLATATELGFRSRAKTLSDGLRLWAGMNYRVATNKAFLRILPQITNEDGVSILQKPKDFPNWPTVDYWPIRQTYAQPLPNRGVLLFQGQVAVDPKVKPFIDAMFGHRVFSTPVRIIEGFNALAKAFELTLFSLFHHFEEFFSACGALGPRAMPLVGGYYGKRAQAFGKKPKLYGYLPEHITTLKAGKQLEQCAEFMDDYIAHGGQTGYITTEGINLMERMLKTAADYFEQLTQKEPTTPLTGVYAAAYVPIKTAQAAYSFHQKLLWDNVQRAKLITYYNIVADGAQNSNLPTKEVKEIAAKYINDNYGGQEWLNSIFRNPKTRQFWTQVMMSLDWTWSQIKTARWPVGLRVKGKARREFVRKIGRHHWFWYLSAIAGTSIAASYAFTGKGPWENELGHKLDVDWTPIWRKLPWNWDWKERGDNARRYARVGKAGRELVRWVTSPLRAFGNKLSPAARTMFEQGTGFNLGSDFPEPWRKEDLEGYQEVYARFKHLMDAFKPFSLSGNNAFLAMPSVKGMTHWKAVKAYEEIFNVKANVACGGLTAALTKASHIIDKDAKRLNREIIEACELNKVDSEKCMREALANVRTKYNSRYWRASQDGNVKNCNKYADALLALGVTENGFFQSLKERADRLSKKAAKLGVKTFTERKKAQQK